MELLKDIFGILATSWGYLGDILRYLGHILKIFEYLGDILGTIDPFIHPSINPLLLWSIGPLDYWSIGPLSECQMLNVNKVKFLSERTSGVPPVIFK